MPGDTPRGISELLEAKLGEGNADLLLPPPVYETIAAELLEADLEKGLLRLRFPMLRRYLNPYGTMQGGMIAAAVDNAVGPLSMLVAPANVTRSMQLEYLAPVSGSLAEIEVTARLVEKRKRRLVFAATVSDPEGKVLATARCINLVVRVPGDSV